MAPLLVFQFNLRITRKWYRRFREGIKSYSHESIQTCFQKHYTSRFTTLNDYNTHVLEYWDSKIKKSPMLGVTFSKMTCIAAERVGDSRTEYFLCRSLMDSDTEVTLVVLSPTQTLEKAMICVYKDMKKKCRGSYTTKLPTQEDGRLFHYLESGQLQNGAFFPFRVTFPRKRWKVFVKPFVIIVTGLASYWGIFRKNFLGHDDKMVGIGEGVVAGFITSAIFELMASSLDYFSTKNQFRVEIMADKAGHTVAEGQYTKMAQDLDLGGQIVIPGQT